MLAIMIFTVHETVHHSKYENFGIRILHKYKFTLHNGDSQFQSTTKAPPHDTRIA
jgi:hypothetical protein